MTDQVVTENYATFLSLQEDEANVRNKKLGLLSDFMLLVCKITHEELSLCRTRDRLTPENAQDWQAEFKMERERFLHSFLLSDLVIDLKMLQSARTKALETGETTSSSGSLTQEPA
mgnify:CR=1 FL=1